MSGVESNSFRELQLQQQQQQQQFLSTSSSAAMFSMTNNLAAAASPAPTPASSNKISLDQIAQTLLRQNFILTALELHTELAEQGREIPRLRDYFSNPSNFEQPQQSQGQYYSSTHYQQQQQQQQQQAASSASSSGGFYPLHKASSIQTFDSLDLTRYSDDVDQGRFQDDKIAVLEFELRKAKETINQLRNTLTMATGKSFFYCFFCI
jgi:hypothetical protein